MNRTTSAVLAGAAVLALIAPAVASADSWRGDHDGYRHAGWRDRDDGRGHGWRENEWREHRGYYGGYGYFPRCYWRNQGFYNWFGQYEVRRVKVCR